MPRAAPASRFLSGDIEPHHRRPGRPGIEGPERERADLCALWRYRVNPYANPTTFWERLTFPSLADAWQSGLEQGNDLGILAAQVGSRKRP